MRGTMLIYRPNGARPVEPSRVELACPPTNEQIHQVLDGYMELVPGFRTVRFSGVVMDCVAFCNEDGQRLELPFNPTATALWDEALRRTGNTLFAADGRPRDFLIGTIAVIFGDREFMAAL